MKDSSTYRFPRTMQQAFGPYTDYRLVPMRRIKPSMLPWLIWGAILIAVIVSIVVYEMF